MRAIILFSVLLTAPATALTFDSADQKSVLTFNGRLEYQLGALGYQAQDKRKAEAVGSDEKITLSLGGAHRLNDTLTLIGEMGWDIYPSSKDSQIEADEVWLGFRFNEVLDVTVGRSDTPFNQLFDVTDIFNIFGAKSYRFRNDILDDTIDDQVKVSYYHNNVDIRAAYAFNDQHKQDNNLGTGSQYSFSAGYVTALGIGAVLAYENKLSADINSDIQSVALGLNYTSPLGIYFGITHGQSYYDNAWPVRRLSYLESVLSYTIRDLTFGVGYNKLSLERPSHDKQVSEYILATEYHLIPQAKVYAEVLLNQVNAADPLYGIGMELAF